MGLAALPPGGRGGYFSGMSGMRVLPVLLGLLGPLLAGCEEREYAPRDNLLRPQRAPTPCA